MLPPVFHVCAACGAVVTLDAAPGYRCPRRSGAGSDDVHRLVREIEPARLHWPDLGPENPLLRYRQLTTPYLRFRIAGGSDGDYVEGVRELAERVEASTGARCRPGPVLRSEALELATGRESGGAVFVQDRSDFAGGPGRWLALLFAAVPSCLGSDPRALVTFGQADDSGDALQLAGILGRELEVAGDSADLDDTVPWTAWRDLNVWVTEGEELWAYVAVDRTRGAGLPPDRVFLASGGSSAAGWVLGLRESFRLGALGALPRIHVVESEEGPAVGRRYDTVVQAILTGVDDRLTDPVLIEMARRFPRVRGTIADRIVAGLRSEGADHPVRRAVEAGLRSVTSREGPGDGHADVLVRAMLESGGFPLLADGDEIIRGRMLSRKEPPDANGKSLSPVGLLPLPGLASAGMLGLFSHGDLPGGEVLLVVDP